MKYYIWDLQTMLKTLDLVDCYENSWYNTTLSSTYLIKGKPLYQGNSILWRRDIKADWDTLKPALEAGGRVHFPPENISDAEMDARREEYITAMDNIVRLKVPEILEFFGNGDIGEVIGIFRKRPEDWRPYSGCRRRQRCFCPWLS